MLAKSSDLGGMQQSILIARSVLEKRSACVLTSLHDQLSADGMAVISSIRESLPRPDQLSGPVSSQASRDEASHCYEAMQTSLFTCGEAAIPPGRFAHCLVHKQKCPINPGWVFHQRQQQGTGTTFPREVHETAPACAWWAPGSQFSAFGERTPLQVNISSLICVDYCPLGQKLGKAGESNEEHAIWLATRRVNAKAEIEDLFFTETGSR